MDVKHMKLNIEEKKILYAFGCMNHENTVCRLKWITALTVDAKVKRKMLCLARNRLGGENHYWMNGLYEACCILFVFPVIVSMGAGGKVTGKRSTAVCKFLGDISYPVYITHYPLVYTYTAWVCNNNATLAEGIPYMILTFAGAFVLAYACLKLYDEPIRKWLTDRFLKGKKAVKN
mgnify:CR=1 FL=1